MESQSVVAETLGYLSATGGVPVPGSPFWMTMPQWGIDSINGRDSNQGTLASPIKTAAEYTRRTDGRNRQISGPVDIFVVNSLPVDDPFLFTGWTTTHDAYQKLHGVATVLRTGSLTGVRFYNNTTPLDWQITDGTLDWTPFVGHQIHITSGPAAGARGWIIKAVSPGVARIDWLSVIDPTDPANAIVEVPVPGNSYEIVSLPAVPNFQRDFVSRLSNSGDTANASIELIDFCTATFAPGDRTNSPVFGDDGIFINYCRFPGIAIFSGDSDVQGCLFSGLFAEISGSGVAWTCCSTLNNLLLCNEGGHVEAFGLIVQSGSILIDNANFECHHVGTGLGLFDCAAGAISFDDGQGGRVGVEGTVWIINCAGPVIKLNPDGVLITDSAYTVKFNGTSNNAVPEFSVRGATSVPPYDPVTGAPGAAIPTTFANFKKTFAAGGFQGTMIDPVLRGGCGAMAQQP